MMKMLNFTVSYVSPLYGGIWIQFVSFNYSFFFQFFPLFCPGTVPLNGREDDRRMSHPGKTFTPSLRKTSRACRWTCAEVNIGSTCIIYGNVCRGIFFVCADAYRTCATCSPIRFWVSSQLNTTALHINQAHPNTLGLPNRCLTKPPYFKQFDPCLLKNNARTPRGLGPDLAGNGGNGPHWL